MTKRGPRILAICLAVVILGLFIRVKNLSSLHPFDLDERAWLLIGTSLLTHGVPSSWTIYWEKYDQAETIQYGGRPEVVVSPYLDHPPLFALGMGAWARLTGNDTPKPLDWATLRLPMIVLSFGSIALTWLLLRRLFDPLFAAVTAGALSVFPAHVIASRFIVPEHAIAFLLMACLLAFTFIDTEKERNSRKTMAIAFIVLVCSLAILLKLSALVIPATLGLLALLRKKTALFIWITAATLVSIGLLFAYGAFYDWQLFLDVFAGHTGRPQSFWHFWSIVTQMDLGYFPLRDPSLIVGFIGLVALLADREIPWQKRLYLFVPLLSFSLLFLFIAPVESYGWYKYPLLPLLAIGSGYVFTQLIQGRVIYYVLLLPMFAMMLEHSALLPNHELRRLVMLLIYAIVTGAIIFKHYFRSTKLLPVSAALVAVTFFLQLAWVSILLLPEAPL